MKNKISQRLKLLREERGLSQQKFADEINLSSGFIAMIETNKKAVSCETLILFSEYFGVSSDFLLGLSDIKYK